MLSLGGGEITAENWNCWIRKSPKLRHFNRNTERSAKTRNSGLIVATLTVFRITIVIFRYTSIEVALR